jgi:hypothetical protein
MDRDTGFQPVRAVLLLWEVRFPEIPRNRHGLEARVTGSVSGAVLRGHRSEGPPTCRR